MLTSMDEKFKLEGTFPAGTYYLTMSTIGLPGEIKGEVLGGPYGSFTTGSEAVKGGQVSLEVDEEGASPALSTWGGKAWQTVKGAELEGKVLSGSTGTLGTFVATALIAAETPEVAE